MRFVCFAILMLVPAFASAHSQWDHQSEDTHLAKKKKQQKKEKNLRHKDPNARYLFPNIPETPRSSSFYDPMVDYYLNNKIILCVGPALGRYKMLKKTTEFDLKQIPFKKIFITTNDPKIVGITFKQGTIIPSQCYLIPNRGKQVDCTNCIISTLRHAVNDPDILDDDIILFKHESLYINDMNLLNKAINKIVNEGYDMVNRMRGDASCTDAFYLKVSAVRKIVANFPDITELTRDLWCCEVYFHQCIVKYIQKIYTIFYDHNNGGPTELGFYHYPSGWDPFWDRKNYRDLYK